jgi:hypothetical protein
MRRAGGGLTRNAVASLVVVAVCAAVGLGLPWLNNRLPATRAVPAGKPFLVASGVTVMPPPHALYDVTKTATTRDGRQGAVLFVLGSLRFTVSVVRFDGTLPEAAKVLRMMITRARGYQALGPEGPVVTRAGVAGLGGGYTTAAGTGRYAVFVADGLAVQATYNGSEPGSDALSTLQASVDSIAFGSS